MDEIRKVLKDLESKQQRALDEYNKYREAIEALQRTCEHNWVDVGHGHNTTYYCCSICGRTDDW